MAATGGIKFSFRICPLASSFVSAISQFVWSLGIVLSRKISLNAPNACTLLKSGQEKTHALYHLPREQETSLFFMGEDEPWCRDDDEVEEY